METHNDEKSSNSQKSKKKKKEIRLKNIDIPLSFRPPILSENPGDELQITRVLDYSESDFPLLGCKAVKNPKNRNRLVHSNNVVSDNSIDRPEDNLPDWKLSKKVLKSNKHKEAFKVQFEEIFSSSSNKSAHNHRIRQVKHYREDLSLGGNPLDSDNPTRRKGVINSKPKIKRISRTKAMVFKAREEMQRLKEVAECISIKDNEVQADEDVLVTELWKPLCLLKANDIKKCLQNKQIHSEEEIELDNEETESLQSNNMDKKLIDDSLSIIKTESVCSADSKLCEQDIPNKCTFTLEEVLKDSEIPPYKLLIHNNNFKRYSDNCITSTLNEITEKLVSQLVRYQYKKFQIDPLKAAAKKRYVLGLRQVKKYTKMNKTKLIIFVPNMEESLYEAVDELKSLAVAYCIPYLFAFSRKKLGKLAYKKVGVCCLGILDYSGAEENFKTCIEALTVAKKLYNEKCSDAKSHYEQYFSNTTITSDDYQTAEDVSEEIRTDFISKLSLSDANNEPDNVGDLDDSV